MADTYPQGVFMQRTSPRFSKQFARALALGLVGLALSTAVVLSTLPSLAADAGRLALDKKQDGITVLFDGRPLTTLHFGPKWDKPFLHPLRSSSGVVISRGFPLDPQPGESKDHAWHRGIWYGHGDVNGEDFWRELGPEKSGKLVPVETPEAFIRNGAAVLKLSLAMQGRLPEKKRYGTIGEQYLIRVDGPLVFMDAVITVTADAGMDLRFGDSDDGGFGFRLSDAYREDRGAQLINSAGGIGSKAIWGKSSKWVDYSTSLEGKTIGLAVLDHPSNVRYPEAWHARGYALCAANPFALGSFAEDKTIDGSYVVKAGDTLTLRYRVVIHEGKATHETLDRWQREFAAAQQLR
ncbi:MAG: PmoA family protein [Bryobacterales bacterium]|nr:PmoA family protein [Bryobacterales bacterium]